MPLVGLALALALKHAPRLEIAPNALLVAMVVTTTPTANNVVVMAEARAMRPSALARAACASSLVTFLAVVVVVVCSDAPLRLVTSSVARACTLARRAPRLLPPRP